MKYVDRKMQDNFAGLENARQENAELENARQKPEDPEMNHKQVSYSSTRVRPVFYGRKHNKQWTATDNMQKNIVNIS